SNNDTRRSNTAGESLTVTVDSAWVGLGFATCSSCGEAELFIDGVSQGVIDTYSFENGTKAVYYDLEAGLHTLNVTVLGSANPSASNTFIYFDYLDSWDGALLANGFFEQDDLRVYGSSDWGTVNAVPASGGSYFRDGSNIWFPFTGDSVTFQALAYADGGEVELRVDDQSYGFVDLYSPTEVTHTFSIDNLSSGVHVLQLLDFRGRATLDGFNTPAVEAANVNLPQSGLIRHEENSQALLYNGSHFSQRPQSWVTFSSPPASRGHAFGSSSGGDSVSLTFDGEWVNVGFASRPRAGLAEIFIDGVSQGTFDTYSRVDDTTNVVFGNLAPGTHTIEIQAIDQANLFSSDDFIYLDYIDVWDGTPLADGSFDAVLEPYDGDERIYRDDQWTSRNDPAASDGAYLRDGSNAWFHFIGDSVSYHYLSNSFIGDVEVWIDGSSQGVFDLNGPTSVTGTLSFDGLGNGPHVIQIREINKQGSLEGFSTPGSPPFYSPPVQSGIIRYEEGNPALLYNGAAFRQTSATWEVNGFPLASRGFAHSSNDGGDSVSLTFDGEWVNVGFVTRPRAGLAEIFIDGVSQGTVDTYSRVDSTTNLVFGNLAPGTHTIEIQAIDQAKPLSSDDYVYLDYIDVWDGTPLAEGTFNAVLEPYDGDERIFRDDQWTNRNDPAASDGAYLRDGSNVWFHFIGDSVSYSYLSNSFIGEVEILIDGVSQGLFDLYSPTSVPGTLSFDGFGSGLHVIQIREINKQASLEGFTTPGNSPFYTPPVQTGIIRYEELDPAFLYNGLLFDQTSPSWQIGTFTWASRGYGTFSDTANDTIRLDFDGSWVHLGFVGRTTSGQAEIFIDGISQGIVDTFTDGDSTVSVAYGNLTPGPHTLEVVVLGTRSANASGDFIRLDYVDVWGGTPMPEETVEAVLEAYDGDERIFRSSDWNQINSDDANFGTYLRGGANVWYPFTGSSVNYNGFIYSGGGTVEVFIDGVSQGTVDLSNVTELSRPFAYANLSDGPHVMQIQAVSGLSTLEGFTSPGTLVNFAVLGTDLSANIGLPTTYQIEVTNFGEIADTFDITFATDGWPVTLNPGTLTLNPGDSGLVDMTVIVPPTATILETNGVTLTATALGQNGFETVNHFDITAVDVYSQLCLALDASNSISDPDFELAKAGLAAALRDPDTVPRNGSVELSLVQFPLSAQVIDVEPTVIIDEASAEAVAQQIEAIVKATQGITPMEDGVRTCKEAIVNSRHFANAENHIINLATDGAPAPFTSVALTLNERQLAIDAGINQINAEAIGDADIPFLQNELVYPQPGYLAPPFDNSGNGFVIPISGFEEFAESIKQKLQFVLGVYNVDVAHSIPVTGTVVLSDTISPAADVIDELDNTLIDWQYSLGGDGSQQILTLQTALPNMQPGETRVVADSTVISYTAPSGKSAQFTLPPLTVAAPHIIALNPPTQTVGIGATALYTATLLNLTAEPLTMTLDVIGFPNAWVSGAGEIVVPADSSLDLPLQISVPDEAALGNYSFAATVTLQNGGQDQASAQLEVVDGFNVTLSPSVQTVLVNSAVSYTLSLENPLPTEETYALSIVGLDGAAAANLPPTISVPGGSSAEIELPVTALFEEGLEPFIVQATDDDGVMGSDDALLDVVGETGVELSLTPTGDAGGPDTPIAYELTVTNTGDFIDTYDLEVDLPAGWTFEWLANGQIVDPLTIIPVEFDMATIGLLITPAAGTTPGSYPFSVTATSTIYPSATDTISDQLEVLGSGVTVEITPGSTTIDPLAPAVWDITVTNTGVVADTFDLSTLGLGGETGQFSSSVVSLGAGQSNTVQLTIDAPDFLISGPIYKLHVEAVSQTDSRIANYDLADVELSGYDGVAIEWLEEAQSVDAGESIDFFVTITNTGNISETFDLSLVPSGGNGDHVALQAELSTIVLPAGFSGLLRVTAETTTAASGSFTLEASASNGQVSAADFATLNVNSLPQSDLNGTLTLQGRSNHSIDLELKLYSLDD
ncbi:MAG: DUF1194 domain-containing protein, partial [Chloroflexota bacterium]